jgi:hypothetical protein
MKMGPQGNVWDRSNLVRILKNLNSSVTAFDKPFISVPLKMCVGNAAF